MRAILQAMQSLQARKARTPTGLRPAVRSGWKAAGALLAGLASLFTAAPFASAEEIPVDVELVIAVDVSRSMSPHELEIQRRGYAEALVSDQVVGALTSGAYGQVAITYIEWAGAETQIVVIPWTLVAGREDAEALAADLTAVFNPAMRRTSISGLLAYASASFQGNGFDGFRRVIDISGDGPNNHGRPVVPVRDAVLAQGITINGLPLMTSEGMGVAWQLPDLDRYYRDCVVGGPGHFVIPVLTWEDFPESVRHKIVLELVGREPEPPRLLQPAQGYDCLIGEKIWQDMFGDPY